MKIKQITVTVGDCTLRLDEFGKLHVGVFAGYGQNLSTEFTEDVKAAFIAFTSLVIEREDSLETNN